MDSGARDAGFGELRRFSTIRFHVLGPVRVINRGGRLSLGGKQQRLVLALLLAHEGEALSTTRLVDALWIGEPPETARKIVHGYVHHLRRVIGDALKTEDNGYRLELSSVGFDARDFQATVDEAISGGVSPSEISERLAAALSMWSGTPYADVDDALALRPEITRLTELRLAALEMRIDADIEVGGGPDLIGELRSLVSEYPLRERFVAQLMRALYAGGRQTEAIRAYDRTRSYLIENVGLEPSTELAELRDRIIAQDEALNVRSDTTQPSHAIRGYEMRGTVIEGLHERTDLAYQTSVGRQVTIRVFEGDVVNDPGFISAFSDQAGSVSRLTHPHLVPITDFWREPNRAYVVAPFFEGGSLAQRTLTAPAFEQVASALAYAHRQSVVHGRISASDVSFDLDGNAYLGGFSIGVETDRAGGDGGVKSDIAGLATLLVDHVPEAWLDNDDVRQLISSASSGAYRRVEDFARDFRRALGRDVTAMAGSRTRDRSELRNPFKGLRAFHETDAADFFGRDDLIENVVEHLDRLRFVAVVGASGGGKSSLVRAGVIPMLKRRSRDEGSNLLIAEMFPGTYPFEQLEDALLGVAATYPDDLGDLMQDDGGLLRMAKAVLPEDTSLVIVIDQFEELFALVADESERSLFIRSLMRALDDEQSGISVVITLRADYFNRPLEYGEFAQWVDRGLVPVTPMSVDGIGRAISGPARAVGLDLEPGLVSRIVTDLEGQPGRLPLLQYALTEMFEARDSNLLTIPTYHRIGGVAGALAGRAEVIYNELDQPGREAVKQCLLRLVTITADRNDLRRRVRRTELTSLPVDQHALEEVIQRFGASRLLSFDRDPQTRAPTVEVAHEALFREWDRLRSWIDQQRDDILHHRAFAVEVEQWRDAGRDESYLLRGGRLEEFQSWAQDSTLTLTRLEADFLEDSVSLGRAEQEKETRDRRRLRAALAVVATLAAVALVFGMFALASSRTAERQSQLARAEALAASSAATLGTDPELSLLLGIQALELDPTSRSAIEVVNRAYQSHRTILRLGDSALIGGSMSPDGSMIAYATSDELQLFAADDPGEPSWVWSAPVGHTIVDAHFTADNESVLAGLGLLDGPCAWERWVLIDAGAGSIESDHTFPGLIPYSGGPAQNGPFVDPTRPMILGEGGAAICQANPRVGRVVAIDLQNGEQQDLIEGVSRSSSFAGIPSVSAQGDRLAVGVGEGGVVVDLGNDTILLNIPEGMSSLNSDGSMVLAGNNPVELWSVDDGEKIREFKADFKMAWFSPGGTMVYGATSDGRILVFDVENADLLFELRGHRGLVRTVQMSDDETLIASFADDGVRVWDIGAPLLSTASQVAISATVDDVPGLFQVPDMHVVDGLLVTKRGVCAESDCDLTPVFPPDLLFDQTTIFDLTTGREVSTYTGGLLAVDPTGELVAMQQTGAPMALETTDNEGVSGEYIPYSGIVIADLMTGEVVTELEGLCLWYTKGPNSRDIVDSDQCTGYPGPWRDYAHFAAFSPDGSLLAMAGSTGRYSVWDVDTGEMIWARDSEGGEDLALFALNTNVAFTPDGQHLLVAQFRTIEVLEVGSYDNVVAEFQTEAGSPTAMEFTPDGSLLVFNDVLLNVHVVDTSSWERVATFTGQQGQWLPDVSVDPTGTFVATAGLDNESRVWDIAAGEERHRFTATPIAGGLGNVDWVDEDTLVLGNRQWAVVMTLDPEVLLASARERLTRMLTATECATYGIDPCPSFDE